MPSAKVAPDGEAGSGHAVDAWTEPSSGAASDTSAANEETGGGRGGGEDGGTPLLESSTTSKRSANAPLPTSPSKSATSWVSGRYTANKEKYAALLTTVTKSWKRANLLSIQGVLIGFTIVMSTFETSNRTMLITIIVSMGGVVRFAV